MGLNRVLTWACKGINWRADPRQIERGIAELGLVGGKTVTTGGDRPTADEWLAGKALPGGAATAYRRTVARLMLRVVLTFATLLRNAAEEWLRRQMCTLGC